MQNLKNLTIIYLLVFTSCSPLALQIAPGPTSRPAQTAQPANTSTPAPAAMITPAATVESTCAMISADEALRLRQSPGVEALVLAFMLNGEEVRLLSTTNPDWWLIKRGNLTGYARSKYMRASQCETTR